MAEIDLEALDEYLMSDTSLGDCMLLSDLDGFPTCIVVGLAPIFNKRMDVGDLAWRGT